MPHFILCADDYAQNAAIDHGILELLAKKRISAVSCMTSSPGWPQAAKAILPYQRQIDIGLHFNLTQAPALSNPLPTRSHLSYLIKSQLRLLDKKAIADELNAQWQQFCAHIGSKPSFIDGHQHIHCLPQVRQILLDFLQKHDPEQTTYVRLPDHKLISNLCPRRWKSLIIAASGGLSMQSLLTQSKRPFNSTFAGAYSFNRTNYRSIFQRALRTIAPGGLIMCHPGSSQRTADHDPIAPARARERAYFASDDFLADCQNANLKPARFSECI